MAAVGKIPQPMDHHEKMKLRAAAYRVKLLYPGAMGEILSREILTWEEFGYRFGSGSLINELVDVVLKTELPSGIGVSHNNQLEQHRPFNYYTIRG